MSLMSRIFRADEPTSRKGPQMGIFAGKKGMVLGVANDYSIAWAITRKLLEEVAELGFTHLPGEKMERRVRKLVEPIGAKLLVSCDVQKDEDIARTFEQAGQTFGALDFVLHSIAFAPLDDIKCNYVDCSREGFKTAMDVSVYSLAAVARQAAKVMPEGGSLLTLTYFGGERVVPGYNLMGVAKAALDASVKYLAYDLGPRKIRVNGLSAGPVKTLAASAVGDHDNLAWLYTVVAPWAATSAARRLAPPECSCSPIWPAASPAKSFMSIAATM